jgi:hypothetical protein
MWGERIEGVERSEPHRFDMRRTPGRASTVEKSQKSLGSPDAKIIEL